nr:hypothetical protein [Mycobacterium gordonae]
MTDASNTDNEHDWRSPGLADSHLRIAKTAAFETPEEPGPQAVALTRGLEPDLDPWQADPADQLPEVVEPGRISLTLWTEGLGDHPSAFDVSFTWDGDQSASWYVDISISSGSSVMSSSPGHGVLGWPNGKDVVCSFNWIDYSLEGHGVLPGMAPTSNRDASGPKYWIRLGYGLIDFVLQEHGAGDARTEYLDTTNDVVLNLDKMFQAFLNAATESDEPDFSSWVEEVISVGRYKILDEDD